MKFYFADSPAVEKEPAKEKGSCARSLQSFESDRARHGTYEFCRETLERGVRANGRRQAQEEAIKGKKFRAPKKSEKSSGGEKAQKKTKKHAHNGRKIKGLETGDGSRKG